VYFICRETENETDVFLEFARLPVCPFEGGGADRASGCYPIPIQLLSPLTPLIKIVPLKGTMQIN
jgi:hypothetical protein